MKKLIAVFRDGTQVEISLREGESRQSAFKAFCKRQGIAPFAVLY